MLMGGPVSFPASRLLGRWWQPLVCLALIVGVLVGDVTIAQARQAENHRKAAARALHATEVKYADQVDVLSRELFATLQPVQDALDHLDALHPAYIAAARDAVVNTKTSAAVHRLATRLATIK